MGRMIIRSLTERDGGSDHRMHGKTYHFRPNSAGDEVCPVDDKADIQGFLALPNSFEIYDGEEVPAEAGVTPDRGVATPSGPPEEVAEAEPEPGPTQSRLDPQVKDQLLQMDQEALIGWASENAPGANLARNMKVETMVARIEESMNGDH